MQLHRLHRWTTIAAAVSLVAFLAGDALAQNKASRAAQVLDASHAPLRTQFNRAQFNKDADSVRIIVLVAPT